MAGKFKIFCDDCPTFEPNDKPLVGQQGLINQTITQQQQAVAQVHKLTSLIQSSQSQLQQQQVLGRNNNPSGTGTDHDEKLAGLNHAQPSLQQPKLQQQPGAKREPLGLRQPVQSISAAATAVSEAAAAVAASSSSGLASITLLTDQEDQENDISMASLGSDFAPSFIHEEHLGHVSDEFDNSFDLEDEELSDSGEDALDNGDRARNVSRAALKETASEQDIEIDGYCCEDLSDDVDLDDPELQEELSNAFKRHDDSQLFKAAAYVDDIEEYLCALERKTKTRPLPNYMDYQGSIDSSKRTTLIDWLVEVTDEYNLQVETLFICTAIIDRFLSKKTIELNNFQLLGAAAMFIASKYEEIYPPNLLNFVEITDHTFTGRQIIEIEQDILKSLNFRISFPTTTFFLQKIFAYNKFPKAVYHMAEYLCHLSLLDDSPYLEYLPSEIALAAVVLAAHELGSGASISSELMGEFEVSNWEQLNRRKLPEGVKLRDIDRRKYTVDQELPICIEALLKSQEESYQVWSEEGNAITRKFSSSSCSCVASIRPPKASELVTIFT